MYITSELFSPETANYCSESPLSNTSHGRNTVADTDQHTTGLGKRKWRSESEQGISCNGAPRSAEGGSCRSPARGSSRLQGPNHGHIDNTSRPCCFPSHVQRPLKQLKRSAPKKIIIAKQPSQLMDFELHPSTDAHKPAHTDLRPCHICHKAPKRKSDIENYLDCRSCASRACYVCARTCGTCETRLCSKCSVEVGQEGDALCLACYQQRVNT